MFRNTQSVILYLAKNRSSFVVSCYHLNSGSVVALSGDQTPFHNQIRHYNQQKQPILHKFDKFPEFELLTHAKNPFSNFQDIGSSRSISLAAKQDVTAFEQKQRKLLPDNIRFHYCPNQPITAKGEISKRPLVFLFGWMLSQDKNLNKYRRFWFERGFDVLSMRCLPWQLLLPYWGGRVNALRAFSYITNNLCDYDEVLIHAFSVGGYQLGEVIQVLDHNKDKDPKAKLMYDGLKGIIIDSCVFSEHAAPGVSRAITLNPIVQPLLQAFIWTFLTATKPIILNRLKSIQDYLVENEKGLPGLILCSKTDVVSSIELNTNMYNKWTLKSDIVKIKIWEESPHVLHYKHHKEEYTQLVDEFVSKIGITKAKKL